MSELKGSLKLENDSSSPSPPQLNDSKFESGDGNSSPPPPPPPPDSNSNSSSSNDDSSNNNSSPSPDRSPPSPSPSPPPTPSSPPPTSSSPPTESPSESPPSPSSSESESPPKSPPPPKQQSSPPPSPSKKESPPPPQEESSRPSPPPPPMQQSPPPPPSDNSLEGSIQSPFPPPPPSSNPTPPPPTSSKSSKSPIMSPPSTNASIQSSLISSHHALAPSAPSTYQNSSASRAPSPSEGGSKNETQDNTKVTKSQYEVMIDAAVAGAFFAAVFIAFFFILQRRKERKQALPGNYTPPPGNNEVRSDTPGKGSPMVNNYEGQRGQFFYSPESGIIAGSKTHFTYEELMEMTNGFAHENVIGEGGFGCVYKGRLLDGKFVAIKRLKVGGGQGDREFNAEVEIISRVHHRHLVSLVGYCIAENQRLLIYDFVGNKTLEHHLHGKDMPVLEWPKRVKIAVGAAKGVAYLHEDCQPRIIHRDIKSANILLEDDFEAQVADFGLARLNDTSQTHVSTRVMGTFGYLAPEYASSGKLTDRSDVFSFGVVLLELITGRKPVDPTQPLGDESLVEWARPRLIQALESGDFSELIDPRLEKRYVESEVLMMIEAAAACVRHSAAKRPRMALVVRALDFGGSDLSNGVKVGESISYDSGKYSAEISVFRRMALGIDSGSECDIYSEDLSYRDMSHGHASWRSEYSSSEFTSVDSEIQPFNKSGVYSDSGASGNYDSGRFK
ncbi:hypothetical protein HRI_004034700 [Hibiscus trionum]|uniref:non-specific serine/threonine protein kinase n=1 Tax=Hibiscus trionum TaxID=183268 RepID=A0A9W7ML66_HIBTR|nr:hypothetical protein HRI_004034700 [Hibiscus trionum]